MHIALKKKFQKERNDKIDQDMRYYPLGNQVEPIKKILTSGKRILGKAKKLHNFVYFNLMNIKNSPDSIFLIVVPGAFSICKIINEQKIITCKFFDD
ncbi:hypothetical protein BpHYR1_033210 [Brachionus plicatilis]|uniref:Uncharacterized protein n=1 Tax=Brachionus plicatilis TaxID=10195 RepID=A0A3M7SG05_BRAPC|nr:hypothetical protein BpHYR1_033210 [Brachionus plicatilis]